MTSQRQMAVSISVKESELVLLKITGGLKRNCLVDVVLRRVNRIADLRADGA